MIFDGGDGHPIYSVIYMVSIEKAANPVIYYGQFFEKYAGGNAFSPTPLDPTLRPCPVTVAHHTNDKSLCCRSCTKM